MEASERYFASHADKNPVKNQSRRPRPAMAGGRICPACGTCSVTAFLSVGSCPNTQHSLSLPYRPLLKPVGVVASFFPDAVPAEVGDKVSGLSEIWSVAVVAALLGFGAARANRWAGVAVLLPVTLWFVSLFLEIHAADLAGPLYRERGAGFFWQAYAAFALVLAGIGLGARLRLRKTS